MTRTAQPPAEARKRTAARWRRAGPLIVVLVAVAALAAACGGGSHDAASASPNATSAQSSARQSGILYASCIRAHGVQDFPDSAVVSGGIFHMDVPSSFKNDRQFQSASQACRNDLPAGDIPARKHVNIREELNFARCMRSHGISDFPDPLPGGGWDVPGDTNSPQFDAAALACQSTGIHWNSAP
jgi:hypothetical protein